MGADHSVPQHRMGGEQMVLRAQQPASQGGQQGLGYIIAHHLESCVTEKTNVSKRIHTL